MEMVKSYIEKLQHELKLEESFATEVKDVYAFPVTEEISVLISELPREGFSLMCTFADCPKEDIEELFTEALRANLLGEGTDRAVLGLDEKGEKLTLTRDVDSPVRYEEFRDILEDFLNSIDFWIKEVSSYSTTKEK